MVHCAGINFTDALKEQIDESRGVGAGNNPPNQQGWVLDACRLRLLLEAPPDERLELADRHGDDWNRVADIYEQIAADGDPGQIKADPRRRQEALADD
jgi:hypothetical protein